MEERAKDDDKLFTDGRIVNNFKVLLEKNPDFKSKLCSYLKCDLVQGDVDYAFLVLLDAMQDRLLKAIKDNVGDFNVQTFVKKQIPSEK
ncbi:MAG: hypothetical protein KDI13_03165 [Alphaproteobacteria bacterium]|nr:hypothetical protein [Alphaproteobacteria bacterium]